MKLLAWNCRGLANAPAVRALLDVQRNWAPDLMFLSETHVDSYPAECFRNILKMDQKLVCPSDGRKGGLLMLWKREIDIQRLDLDPMYIDVEVNDGTNQTWRLTGIYGESRTEKKVDTWRLLRTHHHQSSLPWVCTGDFNGVLYNH